MTVPAVVMGLSATGLHAIRSLGRAGVPVFALGEAAHAGAGSRYAVACQIDPDPLARLDWLRRRFAGPEPVVLMPCSDQDVDLILDHLDLLGPQFRIPQSYRTGLAREIMEKDRFYRLCEAQGLAYPELWEGTAKMLGAQAAHMAYPAFVKPARVQDCKALLKGRKGWVARDAGELQACLKRLPEVGTLLVQRIIEGPESEITLYCGYFDASGPVQGFTARKLRQYPPGFGSASLVQSVDDPETRHLAERFLTDLGYQGVAAAEFKRDPATGRLTIIEVNTRPSLWFEAAEAAGQSPVRAAYHALAETGVALPEVAQRHGVRWRYGAKDVWSAAFYARRGPFVLPPPDLNVVGPAKAHVRAVFAPDDPRPALTEALALTRKALGRALPMPSGGPVTRLSPKHLRRSHAR